MELFTVEPTKVIRKFNPYSEREVRRVNGICAQTFGKYGVRWGFEHFDDQDYDDNVWALEYWFKDPNDALIFALKCLESN